MALVVVCYVLSVVVLLAFAVFAVVLSMRKSNKDESAEEFMTARSQVKTLRIAWSFYASAVGAWVLVGPPSYASYAGWIGLMMYSLASGLPIIAIAYVGDVLQTRLPSAVSLGDFVGWRFGLLPQLYVTLLTTFNMGIAMVAEYTTIGSLFQDYVGSVAYPIIIVVGLVTLAYTVWGGLYVSIITDQVQGIASVLFFATLTIYVAITFRHPLQHPLPPQLAPNAAGYSSIVSMPISMMTATVFSEAIWQRVWASETPAALKTAAFLGGSGLIVAVALAGFAGFLAVWAGLVTGDTNPNLYLFAVLSGSSTPMVSNWVGVLAVVLAVTMNESAVDSLQNGLLSAIGGRLLKGRSVNWARLTVLVVNVPLLLLGAQGFQVLQLFLLANMLCSTSALPLLAGLLSWGQQYIVGEGMLFSCLMSILTVSVMGIWDMWERGVSFGTNFVTGMHYAWLGNEYDWKYLVVPLLSSVVWLALSAGLVRLIAGERSEREGLWGFRRLPGDEADVEEDGVKETVLCTGKSLLSDKDVGGVDKSGGGTGKEGGGIEMPTAGAGITKVVPIV